VSGVPALILAKNTNLVTRTIADETFIVPIAGALASLQQIFALNPVAAFVWEQIDGQHSIEDLRREIADRFDVPSDTAQADLEEFLAALQQAQLVVPVDAPAPQ
jgi:hypothetical protein